MNERSRNLRPSGRGGRQYYVDVPVVVVRQSRKALLLFSDLTGGEAWVPKQLVRAMRCDVGGSVGRHMTVEDLEPDDEVTVTIPLWLAVKEALIAE